MNPRYPIYIISKGRADTRLTVKALDRMGVPFRIVIEPQEQAQYAAVIPPERILTLPFSNLGQGSIPARNWVWAHAIEEGHKRHWILDDNLKAFFRFTSNLKVPVHTGTGFRVIEDLVDRYTNVPMAGMQYFMFVSRKACHPPLEINTRIYSCILLSNEPDYARWRWRGRYNEDTDLSLRFLKAGYCTILSNTFLVEKQPTMRMKGGNTDELYQQNEQFDGRLEMAKSLQRQHPDVTQIKRRWGRWQHVVDYRFFRANRLKPVPGLELPTGINDYGLVLRQVEE